MHCITTKHIEVNDIEEHDMHYNDQDGINEQQLNPQIRTEVHRESCWTIFIYTIRKGEY